VPKKVIDVHGTLLKAFVLIDVIPLCNTIVCNLEQLQKHDNGIVLPPYIYSSSIDEPRKANPPTLSICSGIVTVGFVN
jgi:hypothetical protein